MKSLRAMLYLLTVVVFCLGVQPLAGLVFGSDSLTGRASGPRTSSSGNSAGQEGPAAATQHESASGTKKVAQSGISASLAASSPLAASHLHDVVSTTPNGEVRQWQMTGPWGGDVRSLVASPDNPDILYLGTSDGQLFKSNDGAATWTRLQPGLGVLGVSVDSIVIDPHNSNTMYAGVWGVAVDSTGGVFKSEDAGEHWKLLSGTKGLSVRSVALAPSDSNLIIAGSANSDKTLNGAFRSTDAGKSWHRITPEGDAEIHNINSIGIDPVDPNILYLGTFHLPWKSTDGGVTWKQTGYKEVGMINDSDIFGISVSPTKPSLVYMNACSGIYRSGNGGDKWLKLPGIPFSARRTYALLPDPSNPEVIFAGTSEGLWRSKDGGKRWMLLTSKTDVIRAIVVHPGKPDRVMIATDGSGVLSSPNLGDDFTPANTGFINRHILAIMTDGAQHGRVLASVYHDGFTGSVYASDDDGQSWRLSSRGLGTRDAFSFFQVPNNPDVIYAGTNNGAFRSSDRGATWSFVGVVHEEKKKPVVHHRRPARRSHRAAAETAPRAYVSRYQTVLAVDTQTKKPASKNSNSRKSTSKKQAVKKPEPQKVATHNSTGQKSTKTSASTHSTSRRTARKKEEPKPKPEVPAGPMMYELSKEVDNVTGYVDKDGKLVLYAAAMDGLYRTSDETKGWEKIFLTGYRPDGRVLSVSVSKDAPDRVFVGTQNGLYITHDGGATWDHVDRGPNDMWVKSIAQSPDDPNLVIVGTNQFLYRSTNGGRSWVMRGGGLTVGDYNSVVFNPINPKEVMVGDYSRGGVYRSSDKGYTWDRLDSGLPSSRVWTLTFDPFEPERLFAGSFSSGVYVLTIQRPGRTSQN